MSSNQCPVCQQEAMDAMTKLMKRPHVCQNCGVELRMNLIYTSMVSIIFFALAVRSLITSGFSAGGMVTVLVMTAVFMGVCLFILWKPKSRPPRPERGKLPLVRVVKSLIILASSLCSLL